LTIGNCEKIHFKSTQGYYEFEKEGSKICCEYKIKEEDIKNYYESFQKNMIFKIKGKKKINSSGSGKIIIFLISRHG
jgi:hypothetical protein